MLRCRPLGIRTDLVASSQTVRKTDNMHFKLYVTTISHSHRILPGSVAAFPFQLIVTNQVTRQFVLVASGTLYRQRVGGDGGHAAQGNIC